MLQAASATFTPTFQSVIPQVLPDEDDYTSALSLSRLAYDLEAVLSPVLAAALLLVVPADALFVGTALGFAGSALLVGSVVLPRRSCRCSRAVPRRRAPARGGALRADRRRCDRSSRSTWWSRRPARSSWCRPWSIVRGVLGLGEGVVALVLAAIGAGSMAAALALPRVLRGVAERRVMLGGAVAAHRRDGR